MEPDHPYMRTAYIVMAALAGAITSLSLLSWKTMTRGEVAMTVFVGFTFAIFAVPWLTHDIMNLNSKDSLQAACALTYFGATFANAVIPILMSRAKKWAGKATDQEDAKP